MNRRTHVFPDEQQLYRACAERLAQLANEAIGQWGAFYLALAGGNTPEGLYRRLASPEFAQRIDWSRTHVYFGDERNVPPDHQDSNYRMAAQALLAHVPIPPEQVHRIEGELPAEEAAARYAHRVRNTVAADTRGRPRFDLVLLGMGLDGHVASLFPDTDILHDRHAEAAAVFVPKLHAWRVSLTFPTINNARYVWVLVAGAKKADVVRQALCEPPGTAPLPVQRLAPAAGDLEWFVDAPAARCLDDQAKG